MLILVTVGVIGCGASKDVKEEVKADAKEEIKTIELKLAIPYAQTDESVIGVDYMIKELEKRSNGRVKITPYYAESLNKMMDSLDALKNGVADISLFPPLFNEVMPISGVFAVPTLSILDRGVSQEIALALYKEGILAKDFDNNGLKPLLWLGTDPMGFAFKKKITSLEELKKVKMRTPPDIISNTVKALGASAHNIPLTEVYMALDRGVVDGITSMPAGYVSTKTYEVADYYLDLPMGAGAVILTISKSSWAKIPPDIQKLWEGINLETMAYFNDEVYKKRGTYQDWLKGLGVEVYTLDPAEEERWRQLVKPVEDSWVAKAEKAGFPGQQAITVAKEIIEKHKKN